MGPSAQPARVDPLSQPGPAPGACPYRGLPAGVKGRGAGGAPSPGLSGQEELKVDGHALVSRCLQWDPPGNYP